MPWAWFSEKNFRLSHATAIIIACRRLIADREKSGS